LRAFPKDWQMVKDGAKRLPPGTLFTVRRTSTFRPSGGYLAVGRIVISGPATQ
jgi:hypothetical protein